MASTVDSGPSVTPFKRAGSHDSRIAIAIVSFLLLAQIALYGPSWNSMRLVWETPTYNHGFLVPFVSAYLAWRQREKLAQLKSRPWLLPLFGVAGCGTLWLAGNLAGVNAAQHFAIVGMIPFLIASMLGFQITRTLAFPLAFLIFAVPFGDFMLPYLMDWTAAITIALVTASGVPIFREGLSFMLPTGSWSIIEECSGQRYLIAAVPLACIFAYTSFRLNRTRVQFVFLTVAIALAANWIRAYLIVMVGHLSSMTLATGVDHLVYGWLFFGFVMALVFWIGSRWHEPVSLSGFEDSGSVRESDPSSPAASSNEVQAASPVRLIYVGAFALVLIGIWPVVSHQLFALESRPLDLVDAFSDQSQFTLLPNYSQTGDFKPSYSGMRQELYSEIKNNQSIVWVGKFEAQGSDRKMVGVNKITNSRPGIDGWRIVGSKASRAEATDLEFTEYDLIRGSERLRVWHWFYIDGVTTPSPQVAKLLTALRMVKGDGDQTLAIFLWTSIDEDNAVTRRRLERSTGLITTALQLVSSP